MMREPWFWRSHSITAKTIAVGLRPFSALYDFGQRLRQHMTTPTPAPVPIICIGNATLGGVGKTPFSIALYELLQEDGAEVQFLTRGYGGTEPGPIKADPATHSAAQIGDEPLLLARKGTTWIARDRRIGAQAAAQDGADIIIMDDGFQNPTLQKTVSILLISADDPDGNGLVFPAGPLREPIGRAQSRADIIIYVGKDAKSAQNAADNHSAHFAAWLEPDATPPPQRVMAFSGIGQPDKFFDLLQHSGFDIAKTISFPNHHPFSTHNLSALETLAREHDAAMITTEKDYVRIPHDLKENILSFPVRMKINQPALLIDTIWKMIDQTPSISKRSGNRFA